jgi:3-deoxy-D-manno-octulosonic acid kinase
MARERDFALAEEMIVSSGSLYEFAANAPGARAIAGRGTLYSVATRSGERWLVRRVRHGGLLAPLTGARFWRFGVPRPFNELCLAQELTRMGIPTPEVAAAAVYRSGPYYRGEIARVELPSADDLAACLFGPAKRELAEPEELMRATGRLVAALHTAGLYHPDLNLRNVLIEHQAGAPRAHIIDLEKCALRTQLSARLRQRMLDRLRRSARRFEGRLQRTIEPAAWAAFQAAYAEGTRGLS